MHPSLDQVTLAPNFARTALVASLLLVGVPSLLGAQASTSTDGRRLPVGVDTFTVSYGGQVIGRGIMARARVAGSQMLQVYTWQGNGSEVIVDSLFSDLASLRSLREVRVVGDTTIEVRFADDSIRLAATIPRDEMRRASVPSRSGVFSSASLESLAAAAPLAPGYDQELSVYYAPPAQLGVTSIRLRVTGSETVIDRTRASRDAWVVAATTPGGGTTFWIDKVTRAVLKYDTKEGPATIEFRRQ